MNAVLLHANVSEAASGSTSGHLVLGGDRIGISCDVTAITGTLDIEVEWSPDGINWGSADSTPDVLAQFAAVGVASKAFDVKAPFYRLSFTIGVGPSSFTAVGVN